MRLFKQQQGLGQNSLHLCVSGQFLCGQFKVRQRFCSPGLTQQRVPKPEIGFSVFRIEPQSFTKRCNCALMQAGCTAHFGKIVVRIGRWLVQASRRPAR